MYNNNTNVNGCKVLSPNGRKNKKLVKEYNELVESCDKNCEKYIDISESEISEYIDRLEKEYVKKNGELNESDAYWGVTPFDWMKNVNLNGIFAPVKWLAILATGGLALLLASLWKALKVGKKQLAIAKVRQWIKGLVVTADGGYKKSRKTKDSLFLIQSRARRDILQAAVMTGYAAGLDIPEKHNEPRNPIESAKNESVDLKGMDWFLLEATTTDYISYNNQVFQKDEWDKFINAILNDGVDIQKNNIGHDFIKDGRKVEVFYSVFGKTSQTVETIVQLFGKSPQDLFSYYNVPVGGVYKPLRIDSIPNFYYKNTAYQNDLNGMQRLKEEISKQGDSIDIAQIFIINGNNQNVEINSSIRYFLTKKMTNLQKMENENQKEQSERQKLLQKDAIDKCKFFDFRGNKFNNDANGIRSLFAYLQQNGYDITKPQFFPTFDVSDGSSTMVIDSIDAKKCLSARLVAAKKSDSDLQRIKKEQQKQNEIERKRQETENKNIQNQNELDAVEHAEKYIYNGHEFENSASGILGIANAMKKDGYDIKNSKEIPEIIASLENGNKVTLKGEKSRQVLLKRYDTIKKNQDEILKNALPSQIQEIYLNDKTFVNDPEGINQFFEELFKNGDEIEDTEILMTIKGHEDKVPMNKQQKDYLKKKFKKYKEKVTKELNDQVNQLLNSSYNIEIMLPDDSQVDWSLLNTIKTSSWFGLVKHKTNLWKEAKSVYKMRLEDIDDETKRQKYITSLLININAALSKVTTPSIAKNYCNVINQFNTIMLKRTTKNTSQMMNIGSAAQTGVRIGGHSGGSFESMGMDSWIGNALNEANPNIPQSQNSFFDDYVNLKMKEQERVVEVDYDTVKNLMDNMMKALQNIFTASSATDYLVYKKTVEQMNNFLNELSKSVYVIIDSVAKKVAEHTNYSKNGVEGAINSFLSSSPDVKQNRSLRNLWDNLARPQLDSRAVTRAQTIPESPEFAYLLDILSITVPACIMSLYMPKSDESSKLIATLNQYGTSMITKDIIEKNAPKVQSRPQDNTEQVVNQIDQEREN